MSSKPSEHTRVTRMISPQALLVLKHMEAAGSISNVEAHAVLKVRSVSRRISELVDADIEVIKEFKKDTQGQRYVRYSLKDNAQLTQLAKAA